MKPQNGRKLEIAQIPVVYELVTAKDCPHENTFIKIINSIGNIEITATFCQNCGKQLTEEKWEV